MRISRTAIALGAIAAMTIAAAPSLEAVPYIATDVAGDGNGLNGQGLADLGSTSTPVQLGDADLLGARIVSLYEPVADADGTITNVLTGIEFRTGVTATPTATSVPLIHRFQATAGGCRFWMQTYTGTNGQNVHGTVSARLFDTSCGLPAGNGTLAPSATITGPWLTYAWDAEAKEMVTTLDLKTADPRIASRFVSGEYLELIGVENRANSGAVTAPVVDMMSGGFAIIGADIPSAG